MKINPTMQEAINQKLADQYAMDFAIWLYNLKLEIIDKNSIQQLLEIFKKETNAKH